MDTTRPAANLHSFTQTLNTNWTTFPLQKQLALTLPFIQEWLKPFCYDYELYLELHQSGNLHYHGILDIKDKVKYYRTLKTHVDRIGFVKLDPIYDMIKWKEYCIKVKPDMEKLFKIKLPIRKVQQIIRHDFFKEVTPSGPQSEMSPEGARAHRSTILNTELFNYLKENYDI